MLPGWPSAPAKSSCCRSSSSAPPSPSGPHTASPLSAPSSSSSLPFLFWSSAGRRQSAFRGRQRAPSHRQKSSILSKACSADSLLTIAITLGMAGGVQCMPSPNLSRQPPFAAGAGRAELQTNLGLPGVEADAVVALHSIFSSRLLRLRGGHEKECGCGQTANEWVTDQIDGDKLQSLNTKTGHGIESCLRPPCQIGGSASYLETDGDEQAILSVSFTEGVCLKSVCIVNSGESSPKKVKLFVDREVIDFEEAEDMLADETVQFPRGEGEVYEHEIVSGKFGQARKLIIFIEGNHGAETTRIDWLGLKGQRTFIKHGIVEGAEYELIPDASRYGVRGLMGDRRMAQ